MRMLNDTTRLRKRRPARHRRRRINGNSSENREQSELDALQSLLDQKLISEEDFNARKTGLDEKYQAQRLELEREAARKEKLQKAFSIAITTAENVIKVLGVPPVPNFLLAALAAAQGLAAEIRSEE